MRLNFQRLGEIRSCLTADFVLYTLFLGCLLIAVPARSNNISVSNVAIETQGQARYIKFDIAWENSWRTGNYESNWDAAWVFVKYRLAVGGEWKHLTLFPSVFDHIAPDGAMITPTADGKGVFVYRNADGIGPVSWTDVKLRWNYAADVFPQQTVEIAVMAIEMVYIPTGPFYLGDGSVNGIAGQFEKGTTGTPFLVESENEITLGGGGDNSLGNNNATGMITVDDFDDDSPQTLPAAFPKGYAAFYIMKYELSQGQYVEFLNKLTRTQQASRTHATTLGYYASNTGGGSASPQYRNGIKLGEDPGGSFPRIYVNDLNNNNPPGQADDGENIACNWLNIQDYFYYLDWAGLRPFTELEYEKACRGSLQPVSGEYAWGTTNIMGATGIANSGSENETALNNNANTNYNNNVNVQGPMRVGSFARPNNNDALMARQNSGASYYGVMDMTGNNYENTFKISRADARTYTGEHGNGDISALPANWTSTNICPKGGHWSTTTNYSVSDRKYSNYIIGSSRHQVYSCRGARTAPGQ